MPSNSLPYIFFSLITSNRRQMVSSSSLISSKGNACFALKFSWRRRESLDTPRISQLASWKLGYRSRKFWPSVVQPGVLSLG